MAGPKNDSVMIENAEIFFKNFGGKERLPYNAAGDRNFCVYLPPELEKQAIADGWNVKHTKVRDEGDVPRAYVQVTLNYKKGRPPRAVLIDGRGRRRELGADEVEIFDWVDIKKVDLLLNPYAWTANGNSGVKAYLKSIYVTINYDPLEEKYAELQEADADLVEREED